MSKWTNMVAAAVAGVIVVGLAGPAMAGGQVYAGAGIYGSLKSEGPSSPGPQVANPSMYSGYKAGDVFGPQTGSGHAGGNTGWNGCTGCMKAPTLRVPQPVIHIHVPVPHIR
jgi:hypothetical protein